MKYPSKKEVVTKLQQEGFVKVPTPKWSDADEVWIHNNEIVELGIYGIENGCSVGWTNSTSFFVGFRGVLQWLNEKVPNK